MEVNQILFVLLKLLKNDMKKLNTVPSWVFTKEIDPMKVYTCISHYLVVSVWLNTTGDKKKSIFVICVNWSLKGSWGLVCTY